MEMDEAINTIRANQTHATLGSARAYRCLGLTFDAIGESELALRSHRKEYSVAVEKWRESLGRDGSGLEAIGSSRRLLTFLGDIGDEERYV